ncbi:hypothetical protein ACUR5C_09640 [Aliikangiella sp. IMCC44653]
MGYFSYRVIQLFIVLPLAENGGNETSTYQPKSILPFKSPNVSLVESDPTEETLNDKPETANADSVQPQLIKSCLDGSARAAKEYEALVARLQFENESTIRLLYQFNGPEQKLFKALFPMQAELDSGENLLLLKEYLTQNPQSKVAHWNLLLACASDARLKGCDAQLEQKALQNDPANGQLWMNVAVAKIERLSQVDADDSENSGAIESILESIRYASSAPKFSEYWPEHFDLYESAIRAQGIANEAEIAMRVVGLAFSARTTEIHKLSKFCRRHASHRADIAESCIQLGEQLEQRSETYLNSLFGLSLQNAVYETLDSEAEIAEVNQRRTQLKDRWENPQAEKAGQLMLYDNYLMQEWYQQFRAHGEHQANQFLLEEALRLSKNPAYDPC